MNMFLNVQHRNFTLQAIQLWHKEVAAPERRVNPPFPFPNHHTNEFPGWGVYLPYSLKGITVVNSAIAGRSARSYWDEGRFTTLANSVVSGDFVIIEFGHNDGGSLTP